MDGWIAGLIQQQQGLVMHEKSQGQQAILMLLPCPSSNTSPGACQLNTRAAAGPRDRPVRRGTGRSRRIAALCCPILFRLCSPPLRRISSAVSALALAASAKNEPPCVRSPATRGSGVAAGLGWGKFCCSTKRRDGSFGRWACADRKSAESSSWSNSAQARSTTTDNNTRAKTLRSGGRRGLHNVA